MKHSIKKNVFLVGTMVMAMSLTGCNLFKNKNKDKESEDEPYVEPEPTAYYNEENFVPST